MTTLIVNGKEHVTDADPATPLLYVLRNEIKLNAAKFGCGLGQCGACTVLVEHTPIFSCLTPISVLEGRRVRTLEGLGTAEHPGPLQVAFIKEQAAQCGYCISGMIMSAKALLDQTPHPTREDIKQALDGNLCRCGTHMRIVRAIERAASQGA